MTDLDDGLNTSAPVFAPPVLTAFWPEALPGVENSGNPDALIYMDDQMTGDYSVSHSLDDGLPDPVTMTTGHDASGVATMPLNGREGVFAQTLGWRTNPQSGSGVGPSITTAIPTDTTWGDYTIIAISTLGIDTTMVDVNAEDDGLGAWKLLRMQADANLRVWVWGREYSPNNGPLQVETSTPGAYTWVAVSAYARAINPNIWVPIRPGTPVSAAEAVSQVTHTLPSASIDRRGWFVGAWATGVQTWTAGGGSTEINEAGSNTRLMVSQISADGPSTAVLTASTSAAQTTVAMAAIPLRIMDRPRMDARQFFSPFNKESPVYGWDRDTARTYLLNQVVTPAGVVGTVIHTGQMADIAVKGRSAELEAVSKTRIDMDTSLVLPVVTGDRENCSIDFLAAWAMARGGQYAGPAPSRYTRMWVPFYGSTHSGYASEYTYNSAVYYAADLTPSGAYGLRPPQVVQGPFMSAMYGQQTIDRIEEIRAVGIRLDLARNKGLLGPYGSYLGEDWPFHDQLSKANSSGRITFWIRGDAVVSIAGGATYIPNADTDYMVRYDLYCQSAGGAFLGYVMVSVSSSDRYVRLRMGADHTGSTTIVYNAVGQQIPTDGEWHFVGVKWNYATGQGEVMVDGVTSVSSAYATNGDNDISLLPNTETAHLAGTTPGSYTNNFRAHVPVSDMCIEAGPETFTDNWSWHYPIPQGLNAIMRPTFVPLAAIAEPNPIQGWDLLAQLARATMSAYRANEDDTLEFLPPKYFGEPDQLAISTIVDTEANAAELDVKQDPSKTRNIVTIKYTETRTDTKTGTILDISSALEIPRGTSDFIFALDRVAVEIHGQSSPFGSIWAITNLTDSQIANPATIPTNIHFMTVNTRQDSSGSNLTDLSITARLTNATASTVTIRFINKTANSVWLTNGGDQVPFLRILGYGVSVADGYVTQRDTGSVATRRERSLDVAVDWIQSRAAATDLAQSMVSEIARPRPEVTVVVMGDPRRRPGQLVEVADAQGTQAEGTWRIYAVDHEAKGAQYTQKLKLVYVLPLGDWDHLELGWDEVNWAP
ncbi:MAG: hypothetical protein ABW022_11090 [Actinoplanes sp.]